MTGLIAGAVSSVACDMRDVANRFAAALKANASCSNPDIYFDEGVVLLQCDLRAPGSDLDNARPLLRGSTTGILASDHRLYNEAELAQDFGLAGNAGAADLFGNAVALDDQTGSGLARIDGDFAFARWDQAARSLLLGRDSVGVRPLFYAYIPGEYFAFASLQSVLRDAGFASDAPDREAVVRLAVGDHNTGEKTFLRDVRRVLPGTTLQFRDNKLYSHAYWKLKPGRTIAPGTPVGQLAGQLRNHLCDAVCRRLPQSGPAVTHLSGGLDSSAVSVFAARALRERGEVVHGYSIQARRRSDVDIIDGSAYANVTAQREGNLRVVPVDALPFSELAKGEVATDEPVLASETDPYEKIAAMAGRAGEGPILSGFGGDHLVSFEGHGDLSEYLLKLKWRRLGRELQAHSSKTGRSALRVLFSDVATHILPEGIAAAIRRRFGSGGPTQRSLDEFLVETPGKKNRPGPSTHRNRLALLNNGSITVGLELLARQAARHGTSYAFPFLDRNLMDFALRLPTEVLRVDGVGRWIFREAMDGVLPDSVRTNTQRLPLSPCKVLEAAEDRADFRKTLKLLRENTDLPFDLDLIEQAIDELPDPVKQIDEVNKCAARSKIPDEGAALFTLPLFLGRYLAAQRPG